MQSKNKFTKKKNSTKLNSIHSVPTVRNNNVFIATSTLFLKVQILMDVLLCVWIFNVHNILCRHMVYEK